jgi:hypothetical protein
MEEIWKDIPGYEGLYQVSNMGRVKSVRYNRFLKAGVCSGGYLGVCLYVNSTKKTLKIHKLVSMTFLNHKPDGYKIVVDHIDNDKTNNRIDNLQLITPRENASKDRRGYSSKYVGVSWDKSRNKWISAIHIGGKNNHLGRFESEYEAHLAYQKALSDLC